MERTTLAAARACRGVGRSGPRGRRGDAGERSAIRAAALPRAMAMAMTVTMTMAVQRGVPPASWLRARPSDWSPWLQLGPLRRCGSVWGLGHASSDLNTTRRISHTDRQEPPRRKNTRGFPGKASKHPSQRALHGRTADESYPCRGGRLRRRPAAGGDLARGASGALWGSCGVVWIVHGESAGGGGRRRSVWAQRPGQTGGRRTVAQTSGTAAVLYWHLPFSFLSLLKHCAMVHNTSRHATALRCTHLH